jgi:hypothetical protein
MNTKNTATTTKSRITKRIGRLAVAAAAATALALSSASTAHAMTGKEAFDKLPASCTADVTDGGTTGYMVVFSCPGPPIVIVQCIKREQCTVISKLTKSGLFNAKAPIGQVTATGPANSVGTAAFQSNDVPAASTDDVVLRQLLAPKSSLK